MKAWKWVLLALLLSLLPGPAQTPPQISVQLSNGYARLTVTGDVGSGCTLQSVTNLTENWQFLTNLTLSATETLITDSTAPLPTQRFYRVYSQQVPTNVVMTNLVWISPGTCTMGSPDSEPERYFEEGPQTLMTISQGFWMGKYEVTQGEFSSVMGNNPSYFATQDCFGFPITQDLSRPVEQVTWEDAVAYCVALTTQERNAGRLTTRYEYRLPTDAEWEYACRAGTTSAFHQGPALRSAMANFVGFWEYDSWIGTTPSASGIWLGRTTSVGSYAPNPWGLYDMYGNVWEWCQDWVSDLPGGRVTDPQGPCSGRYRVFRGGSWNNTARDCRSAVRNGADPIYADNLLGFRVVLAPVQGIPEMVYIPPGSFSMGSPESEAERAPLEGPQTEVTISQGFSMGKYEVTQREYSLIMGNNPSYFNGVRRDLFDPTCGCDRNQDYGIDLRRPVETVSWEDAVAYCVALTAREQNQGRLPVGYVYRLPTEAEWEYACRAGTSTAFSYGPSLRSGMANFFGPLEYDAALGTIDNPSGIYLAKTTTVGSYAPNPWGLYDMQGNTWEWCSDWLSYSLPGGSLTDPTGPATGSYFVMRGGGWAEDARSCRSANRNGFYPGYSDYDIGFRVVLAHPVP